LAFKKSFPSTSIFEFRASVRSYLLYIWNVLIIPIDVSTRNSLKKTNWKITLMGMVVIEVGFGDVGYSYSVILSGKKSSRSRNISYNILWNYRYYRNTNLCHNRVLDETSNQKSILIPFLFLVKIILLFRTVVKLCICRWIK